MKSKHELEKTAAGNLCSGIQDTGERVILVLLEAMEVSLAFLLLLAETHFCSTPENNSGCMQVPTIS